MSKARAIADNADFPPNSDLDGGTLEDVLQDGNVYNTMESASTQTFDGGTV
jgi:hypothetical protein